jgi:hypothetical protein
MLETSERMLETEEKTDETVAAKELTTRSNTHNPLFGFKPKWAFDGVLRHNIMDLAMATVDQRRDIDITTTGTIPAVLVALGFVVNTEQNLIFNKKM